MDVGNDSPVQVLAALSLQLLRASSDGVAQQPVRVLDRVVDVAAQYMIANPIERQRKTRFALA